MSSFRIVLSALAKTVLPASTWTWTCCGGLTFVYLPFVGYTLASWAAATLLCSLILPPVVICCLKILARRPALLVSGTAIVAVAAGLVINVLNSASTSENGVHGWAKALSMAEVGDRTDNTMQWCFETQNLHRQLEESGQSYNDILLRTSPVQVKVIEVSPTGSVCE